MSIFQRDVGAEDREFYYDVGDDALPSQPTSEGSVSDPAALGGISPLFASSFAASRPGGEASGTATQRRNLYEAYGDSEFLPYGDDESNSSSSSSSASSSDRDDGYDDEPSASSSSGGESDGGEYGETSSSSATEEEDGGDDGDEDNNYFEPDDESDGATVPQSPNVPAAASVLTEPHVRPSGGVPAESGVALWLLDSLARAQSRQREEALDVGGDGDTAGSVAGSSAGAGDNGSYSSLVAGRNWNAEFQALLDIKKDSYEKFMGLRDLERDFVYAAKAYGRIIISERVLPEKQRTIKSVSVGGIAGGAKYIAAGILFKFANNDVQLYDSDESAMKTAAHELKGLQAYYHCGMSSLRVPLMAFITYRGWRLTAVSLLPLGEGSLKYGSDNAGRSVQTENEDINAYMEEAGRMLNVKPHFVGPEGAEKEIRSCCDIEGHAGADGRYYLLDFARLAPPCPPQKPGDNLHRLFRLEFVRHYADSTGSLIPLSSDGFSRMGRHNRDIHNEELRVAFKVLLTSTIPELSRELDGLAERTEAARFPLLSSENELTPLALVTIKEIFHKAGVNLRFLGEVRKLVSDTVIRCVLMAEMCARVCKNYLRLMQRTVGETLTVPSEKPYLGTVVGLLNVLVGADSEREHVFWDCLRRDMDAKFSNCFSAEERNTPLTSLIGHPLLVIERILVLCGISLSKSTEIQWSDLKEKFCMLDETHWQFKFARTAENLSDWRFSEMDIGDLETQVSHLNLIDFAGGLALYYEGSQLPATLYSAKLRLWDASQDKLKLSGSGSLASKLKQGEVLLGMASQLPMRSTNSSGEVGVTLRNKFLRSAIEVFDSILGERLPARLRTRLLFREIRALRKLGEFDRVMEKFAQVGDQENRARISFHRALSLVKRMYHGPRVTISGVTQVEGACEALHEILASRDEYWNPDRLLRLGRNCLRSYLLVLGGRNVAYGEETNVLVCGALLIERGLEQLGASLDVVRVGDALSVARREAALCFAASSRVRSLFAFYRFDSEGKLQFEPDVEFFGPSVLASACCFSPRLATLFPLVCSPEASAALFSHSIEALKISSRQFCRLDLSCKALGFDSEEYQFRHLACAGAKAFWAALSSFYKLREFELIRQPVAHLTSQELQDAISQLPTSLRSLKITDAAPAGGAPGSILIGGLASSKFSQLSTLTLAPVGKELWHLLEGSILPRCAPSLKILGLGVCEEVNPLPVLAMLTPKLRSLVLRDVSEGDGGSTGSLFPGQLRSLHWINGPSPPLGEMRRITSLKVLDFLDSSCVNHDTALLDCLRSLPNLKQFRRPSGFVDVLMRADKKLRLNVNLQPHSKAHTVTTSVPASDSNERPLFLINSFEPTIPPTMETVAPRAEFGTASWASPRLASKWRLGRRLRGMGLNYGSGDEKWLSQDRQGLQKPFQHAGGPMHGVLGQAPPILISRANQSSQVGLFFGKYAIAGTVINSISGVGDQELLVYEGEYRVATLRIHRMVGFRGPEVKGFSVTLEPTTERNLVCLSDLAALGFMVLDLFYLQAK